ncbi:MAG: hypothetical protein FWE15_27990 [Actinomycetia bacterium]|nr:hypothetical protein [Actinomycetes bacterium]
MTYGDTIGRVRKDGSAKVATRAEALAVVGAARDAGLVFAQRQEFGGFVITDATGDAEDALRPDAAAVAAVIRETGGDWEETGHATPESMAREMLDRFPYVRCCTVPGALTDAVLDSLAEF